MIAVLLLGVFLVLYAFIKWGLGAIVPMLMLGAIGLVIRNYVKVRDENRKNEEGWREQEAKKEAEKVDRLQRHKKEQEAYGQQMFVLGKNSLRLFESMPKSLISAEKYLDLSEIDYADGAFAPFWDSIENAAKMLAHFDEDMRQVERDLSSYTELTRKYENTPPAFPLSRQAVTKLAVGSETAKRMQTIVRKAQRNFQFAMIYEQRKTNQILVAGFTNLAQALDRMTSHITASINSLASSVDTMSSTLNESMRAIEKRVGDVAEMTSQHHEELIKEASEFSEREKKALVMLDNIQRRRKPPA